MGLYKVILISMSFWSLLGNAREINTILQVPVPEEIERYGYFLGQKAIVESTSDFDGTVTLVLPPELVGEEGERQIFKYKSNDKILSLSSSNGSGNCLGEWANANCNIRWNASIGNLEQAKAYIEKRYQERHPEAIEGLKQVAEAFNNSPYIRMRFIPSLDGTENAN